MFDEKLREIKSKRLALAIVILLIAFIFFILAIIEVIPKDIEYTEFNKNTKSGNYAKTKVCYLMGPILEVKDNNSDRTSGYYIAVGETEKYFLIRLYNDSIEIPILDKDVDYDSKDNLPGIEVYGSVQLTSSSLVNALNNTLNTLFEKEVLNNSNFENVLGAYHLDTIAKVNNNAKSLFMLCAVLALIGILYLLVNMRIRKSVEQTINDLKSKGKLEEAINEFENEKLIEYKKLKVYLSPKYIFSYNLGLIIIPFSDIKEASTSKKTMSNPEKYKYIIITTKDDITYYIAPISKKNQKSIFNELFEKIKRTIE